MITKARVIAFYLPQFHPIGKNDEWWGKGFYGVDKCRKSKPSCLKDIISHEFLADLGYYDLRMLRLEKRKRIWHVSRDRGIYVLALLVW